MAFIVTDFNKYKSYGNCLNERFVFHLAILKGVARMGKYFSVSIEALAPKQPWTRAEISYTWLEILLAMNLCNLVAIFRRIATVQINWILFAEEVGGT